MDDNMNIKDLYTFAFNRHESFCKQRTDSFNFFLILAGLFVSALALILTKFGESSNVVSFFIVAVFLSVALIIISFLFYKLDKRTLQFIKRIESIIKSYEDKLIIDATKLFKGIEDLNKNETKKTTMGHVLNITYFMFALFGLVGLIASIVLFV